MMHWPRLGRVVHGLSVKHVPQGEHSKTLTLTLHVLGEEH
jgi:hypothetical protein